MTDLADTGSMRVTAAPPPKRIRIDFDPTQGWKAYPDFAQRFAKLWGAEQ